MTNKDELTWKIYAGVGLVLAGAAILGTLAGFAISKPSAPAMAPMTCPALTGCRYYLDCCGEGVPACYQETGLVHGGKLPVCPAGLPLRDLSIFCGEG